MCDLHELRLALIISRAAAAARASGGADELVCCLLLPRGAAARLEAKAAERVETSVFWATPSDLTPRAPK